MMRSALFLPLLVPLAACEQAHSQPQRQPDAAELERFLALNEAQATELRSEDKSHGKTQRLIHAAGRMEPERISPTLVLAVAGIRQH